MKTRFLLLAALLLTISCAERIKLHQGSALSPEGIATLQSGGVICDENNKNCYALSIAAIDSTDFLREFTPGRNRMIAKGTPIEILPGWHTANVYWHTDPVSTFLIVGKPRTVTLAFEAKPGHEYLVDGTASEPQTLWSAWITDLTTGEQVSRLVPRTSFTDIDTGNSLSAGDRHVEASVVRLSLALQEATIDSIANTPYILDQFSAVAHLDEPNGSRKLYPTFLRGQQTCLALYVVRDPGRGRPQSGALVMTTGQLGQLRIVETNAALLHKPGVHVGLDNRLLDQDTIPWYHYLQISSPGESDFFP